MSDFVDRLARLSAWRAVGLLGRLDPWVEDIVQDAVIESWIRHCRGANVSRKLMRMIVANAARYYVGNQTEGYRWKRAWAGAGEVREHHAIEDVSADRRGCGTIAMHRLQSIWPTLSARQRAAIFAVISGDGYGSDSDALAAMGIAEPGAVHAVSAARKRVIERIDQTARFTAKGFARRAPVKTPEQKRAADLVRKHRHRAKLRAIRDGGGR